MNQLVAIALPGGTDFVDTLRRVWDAGDAAFPVDLRLPLNLQRAQVESVGAAALINERGSHSLAGSKPIESGDALVVATSGTSGTPKAAVLTHTAVEASAQITSAALNVTSESHWLACLPLAHIGGLSVVTRALLTETRLTVHPGFDAGEVMKSGATHLSLVTAAMRRIDTARFECILLGGGPPPPDKPENAVATYGMTETGSGIVYDGYPLEGVQLRSEVDGTISVRSPTLFRTYRDGANPVVDGWFNTRDAGEIANDGRLTIFGRADDVIISGGEKIWPAAVEQILSSHPQVKASLITGEPDPEWGQHVVATIESDQPPSLEEVRTHIKATLPAYCAPRVLRIVESLPRTNSGKIRRNG